MSPLTSAIHYYNSKKEKSSLQNHLHRWQTNLQLSFADDINLMKGRTSELPDLTNRLVTSISSFGMKVSTKKL